MNIFVLDKDIEKCAKYHCDKHVTKMSVEYVQILSTVCRLSGQNVGYKKTHVNHRVVVWAGESLANWKWLKKLAQAIHRQYTCRYGKTHKSSTVLKTLPDPLITDIGLTPFAICAKDCDTGEPVESYRSYYRKYKSYFATWKNGVPQWFKKTKCMK